MKTLLPITSILEHSLSESAIDSTLEDSFPASDPPSWTLGVEKTTKDAAFSRKEEGDESNEDLPKD
ncbi:MAG: hypothetical protein ABI977_34125 [Acidobacteriota bacterium]